jgi:prepilin-type N-terminal cleavage/methylation domain-containing protein
MLSMRRITKHGQLLTGCCRGWRTIINNNGFTLTELMLAMVLFSTVLVISTVGFIGMNRTFNRGVVKRQLSESVQAVSEDVGRTLRLQPVTREPEVCNSIDDCSGWHTIEFATVCYKWPDQNDEGGLYRQAGSCVSDQSGEVILPDRYKVRELSVRQIDSGDGGLLYGVSGVFTTMNLDAIHQPSEEEPRWRCKGTAEHPDVASCAVEAFSIIINPQGGVQ